VTGAGGFVVLVGGIAGAGPWGSVRRQVEALEQRADPACVDHGAEHAEAAVTRSALEDVDRERSPEERGPIDADRGRVQHPAQESLPVAHGEHVRQEALDARRRRGNVRGCAPSGAVRDPAGVARRFAGERYEELATARVAPAAHEAVREDAAAK